MTTRTAVPTENITVTDSRIKSAGLALAYCLHNRITCGEIASAASSYTLAVRLRLEAGPGACDVARRRIGDSLTEAETGLRRAVAELADSNIITRIENCLDRKVVW